ncbi:MAG: type I 3-dehydroquinate dehydratase [Chthoniobacterales bacterium]|nr:type I 3-dehydroquinate dehydratase [Chthoniobacterales bacterium]
MNSERSAKAARHRAQLVAVIASAADLARASRLRRTPDLFELRLDALVDVLDELEAAMPRLRAPFIITARRPAEGGAHDLAASARRALLLRFLPFARYIDVELHSTESLRIVIDVARASHVSVIISVHDFRTTPGSARLAQIAQEGVAARADILKLAVRTDTADELLRLQQFYDQHAHELPISAMGVGKLGRESRLWFARRGAALHYGHLGTAAAEGQLSVPELRGLLGR